MKCKHWLFLLFLFSGCFAQIASYFSYPVGDEDGNGWLQILGKANGGLTWLKGYQYGCGYVYHPGLDFNKDNANDCGEHAYSVANGRVAFVNPDRGALIIVHYLPNGDSVYSSFLHMRNINVNNGSSVSRGEFVGEVYDIGTESCHLHFEMPKGCLKEHDGGGYEYPSNYFPCGKSMDFVKSNYNDPRFFIPRNRFLISNNYKFVNHSIEGWSLGNDVQLCLQNQQSIDGWRVYVAGSNPGIVSPQFSEEILAAGAVVHFSMKVENANPIFASLNGKYVCGKVWIKDETDSWNNSVNIELANQDYHYDSDNDGDCSEYNQSQFNFYRANFSSLRNDLIVKQFSIELTDGYGAGNIYWQIDSLKMFQKIAIDGTVSIANSGDDSYAPGDLIVNSVDANSVMLSWNMGLNTSSNLTYYIYRSPNESFSSAIKIDSMLNTYYHDEGLVEGEGYNYWVKAVISGQLSECSNHVYVVTAASHGDGSLPTAPTNLSCVFTSSTSVRVSWSPGSNSPGNIKEYRLMKATCNYPAYSYCYTITPYTEQEVIGLSPDSTYYFWVDITTKDNYGSQYSASTLIVMSTYVYPPQNLVAANSNGAIILSWASQTANVNFKVYRSTSASFSNQTLIQQSGALSCLDTTGQNGTAYYYRVCAFSSTTTSNYSNAVSAIVFPFLPPDSFRVVSVESYRVRLAWERSPGTIYSYRLSRYLDGVQQWSNSVTDTSYIDYTVEQGKTYSYKIMACSHLLSAMSEGAVASVPLKNVYPDFVFLPDADSNGYAEAACLYKRGEDSVIVSVLDLGNNQVLQTFHFGNYQPNSLAEIKVNGQLKLIVALDSLGADTTTLFKVVDVDLNRQNFVLNAPVNFQTGDISYGQISLNWGKGGNPDNLGIEYCLYASQVNDLSSAQLIGSTIGTSYVHEGLSAGGSWYYWLKSSIGLESSSFVGPVSALTNSLSAPVNLVARQILSSKIVLGWASVSGANGYNIYRNGSLAGYVAVDSFVDMSVLSNNLYSYQVAAVFGNYYSSPTDALSVRTLYNYLSVVNPIKDIKDAEFLPDLDNDSLPEVAILGIDTVTNTPTILVKNTNTDQVLAQIPFFSANSVPLYFTPTYLSGSCFPAFTVMGTVADSVKLQTKSFLGTQF